VHLRRKGMTMIRQHFDLRRISQATEGFVGAELEAVVNEAMFPAFLDGHREVESEGLLKAAGDMVPLARSHREHIENMRQLVVSGEARNASRASADDEVRTDRIRAKRYVELADDTLPSEREQDAPTEKPAGSGARRPWLG
jgi:SpoVK/Ycf46/Vps4 family AAA+-type ATPase